MAATQPQDDSSFHENVSPSQPLFAKDNLDLQSSSDSSTNLWGLPSIQRESGGMRSLFFLMGFFLFDTAALYGFSVNLVLYATRSLHLSNVTAVTIGSNFFGTTYLLSFIGGFLADSYWGRYRASAVFLSIYGCGFLLLTLSASAPGWRRAPCIFGDPKCQPPSIWQLVAFFAALMLMAIGYGGSEPCVYAFGADQYDEGNDVEAAQRSSYFNWQYFCSSLGSMIASLFLVYVVNSYGYAIGFAACMLTLILGLTFFFAGTPFYRFQKLQGNPVLHVVQVVVAAVRKRKVNIPPYTTVAYKTCEESLNKVELTNMCTKFRFLEKASVETEGDLGEKDPWRLCEITHVEEVKRFFNLLPLFLSAMIYSIVHVQIFTLFITQGATMDPHFGKFKIPTASLLTFETVAGVIFTLIYEVIMMPLLRKYSSSGQGLANLPRICIGLLLSVLAMLTAAFVERRRLNIVKQFNLYDTTPVPMSVFWQAPQFILVGISEVFAWVGMSEYCYGEAPEGLRSAGSSLFSMAVAAGSFMSTIIIYVVTKLTSHGNGGGWIADNLNMAHLDYFFLLLGGISALNIIYTMFFVHSGKSVEDTIFMDDLHL